MTISQDAPTEARRRALLRPSPKLMALTMILPWFLRRRLLNRVFAYDIDATARIGLSLVAPRFLRMGPGSRIGSATFIGAIARVELGAQARIGNLNWISGISAGSQKHFGDQPERSPALILGAHAAITGRHFIDCCDTVTVGEYTTIAGTGSQVLTHAIDIREARQRAAPVSVGRYCFVGTGCILLKGSALPDYSVLAAGSVLGKRHTEPYSIYSGVPATPVRSIDQDAAYFHRQIGAVS